MAAERKAKAQIESREQNQSKARADWQAGHYTVSGSAFPLLP
jgi:hypothetical protein